MILQVVRSLRESVPKAIGCFLLRSFQEKIQFELQSKFQSPELLDELLCEPMHVREERRTLAEKQRILAAAHGVLSRDVEMQIGEVDPALNSAYEQLLRSRMSGSSYSAPYGGGGYGSTYSGGDRRTGLQSSGFPGSSPPGGPARGGFPAGGSQLQQQGFGGGGAQSRMANNHQGMQGAASQNHYVPPQHQPVQQHHQQHHQSHAGMQNGGMQNGMQNGTGQHQPPLMQDKNRQGGGGDMFSRPAPPGGGAGGKQGLFQDSRPNPPGPRGRNPLF